MLSDDETQPKTAYIFLLFDSAEYHKECDNCVGVCVFVWCKRSLLFSNQRVFEKPSCNLSGLMRNRVKLMRKLLAQHSNVTQQQSVAKHIPSKSSSLSLLVCVIANCVHVRERQNATVRVCQCFKSVGMFALWGVGSLSASFE